MSIDGEADLRRAVTPLRLIFWGGLLCVIDFNITFTNQGDRTKIDILNDFVGMLLITIGVARLATLDSTPSYRRGMVFVQVVSVIATIKAAIDHLTWETPRLWDAAWTVFSLVTLLSIVLFCFKMRLLCRLHGLEGPAHSWKVTAILFLVIYLFPLGGFYAASLVAMATGKSFHLDLGPWGVAFIVAFIVPLIHLLVSTSRMKRAAEGVGQV